MVPDRCLLGTALLLGVAGCASGSAARPAPLASTTDTVPVAGGDTIVVSDTAAASLRLPPVPAVRGPLTLRVVYPPSDAVVEARDSTFLLGSTGTGDAQLTINGDPVRVWPNGAWLAWVPLPGDSVLRFRIEARTRTDSAAVEHPVRWGAYRPPAPASPVWIDSTSLAPQGVIWWPRGEYLAFSLRASEGARVRIRLPDGTTVPLAQAPLREAVAGAVRAFGREVPDLATPVIRERYAAVLRGRAMGPDPGPLLPPRAPMLAASAAPATPVRCASPGCVSPAARAHSADSGWAVVEAIRGTDTVRTRWPLQLRMLDTIPAVAELDDDTLGLGGTDGITTARALPEGAYHWFFPTGTRATVSGRVNDDLRLRLSSGSSAWIGLAEARPVDEPIVTSAVVGSVTLTPEPDRVTVRIPLSRRIPFQVTEDDRRLVLRLYGSVGDVNWIRYGAVDSLVSRLAWRQAADDEVTLDFELARPLWGYRARWDRSDLLLEIRRPPDLAETDPLRGRLIAVDPGHPPGGATGPTGLSEAEANLGVALELRRLLQSAGARVIMTRTEAVPVELTDRVALAERAGADLLISVHNNALPDGINPFTSNGTSVYYHQPRSLPLARAVQEELVRRLGQRDLGVGRGDLALVRGTWMPSVLTEGLFLIVPEQEAALRSVQGRRLYALAVFEGIRRFLRQRAGES